MSCCTPKRESTDISIHAQPIGLGRNQDIGEMVPLPGGGFLMGTDDDIGFPQDGEGPVRQSTVGPFEISPYAVSNADFAQFVDATQRMWRIEVRAIG